MVKVSVDLCIQDAAAANNTTPSIKEEAFSFIGDTLRFYVKQPIAKWIGKRSLVLIRFE